MSKHKEPPSRLRIPPERRVHRAKTDTSIQGRSGLNRGLMGIINEDFQRELQGQEGAERELEKHEVVNALKEQIGQRFDGLQDVLGKMRTDIEVLKDRDRDGRSSDRPVRRRGGK